MAKICRETPFEYFNLAEYDTISIYLNLEVKYTDKYTNKKISNDATQAAEKFMKGYIKYNGFDTFIEHDLTKLYNDICKFDNNFIDKKYDCETLNKYVKLRYEDKFDIDKHEINDIIKSLKNIIYYEPILKIRNEFSKDKRYLKSENMEHRSTMDCFEHIQLNDRFLKDKMQNTKLEVMDIIRFPDEVKNIDLLIKSRYIDNEENTIFVLERKRNIKNNNIIEGYIVDSWKFKYNFTNEQALQFEKDWDISHSPVG